MKPAVALLAIELAVIAWCAYEPRWFWREIAERPA